MKRVISCICCLLMLIAPPVSAYQAWSPMGTSDTSVIVNGATGKPQLKQDLINNLNSGQTNRSFGYVFGRRSAINDVLCDLWDGPTCAYVFPATAQQMRLVSTSLNDAAAGTGVRSVILHYLDANYATQQETVTLNGTTAVTSVATNILRINSIHSMSVGSGGAAAGSISLQNVAGTVTYGIILTGFNESRQAIYTVPAGVTGYISHWQASSGTVTGTHFTPIYIRSTSHEGVLLPGIFISVDEVGTLNNSVAITLPIPIRIPAQTDVKMSAISDAANANAQAMGAIMGWFESN